MAVDPDSGNTGSAAARKRWAGRYGLIPGVALAATVLALLGAAPAAVAVHGAVEMPRKAVTGQLFTIRPVYPADMVIPPNAVCRIEFRWGDDDALFNLNSNNTFGGILFEGPASEGYCGEWNFTLPWVPYRQYHLAFTDPNHHGLSRTFNASLGSTDPHIRSSNLPLVYVLPTSKDVVVGKPLTFTLYRRSGAGSGTAGHWRGYPGWSGDTTGTRLQFEQDGGSTFTFTPNRAGYWQANWAASPGYPWVLSAFYDPSVKRAPATAAPRAPTATAPPTATPPVATDAPSPTITEPAPTAESSGPLVAQTAAPSLLPTVQPVEVVAPPSKPTGGPDGAGSLAGLAAVALAFGVLVGVGLATGRLRPGRSARPAADDDG